MAITLLHTNDFHGRLDPTRAARLAELRQESNALYLDSGDALATGNLGVPLSPEPAWGLLADAGCAASVPGNRESHVLVAGMRKKFAGARHPVVCANWRTRNGDLVFPPSVVLVHGGYRVGIFGVMVPMVTARMASRHASAYVWDQPIPAARSQAHELRPQVDLLVALTHIGLNQDRALAEAVPEIDLVLGGHSHSVLESPERIGRCAICQGGSHGRFVGRYVWALGDGLISAELLPLTSGTARSSG